MAIHLIRKLEQFTELSTDDKRALEQVASRQIRLLSPKEDIVHEGDPPRHLNLILDGWAYRYKSLPDGRRQISAFLIPGDMCDLRMTIVREMDHSIAALTPLRVAEIPGDSLAELIANSARLERALAWNAIVEEAIAREWITNLGRRQAIERISHLLCELYVRLAAVGLTNGASFDCPVTQEQLGDATGLTTVHVNRTVQAIRDQGLIVWKGRNLAIPDFEALRNVALRAA